jgi:hypothetical protein
MRSFGWWTLLLGLVLTGTGCDSSGRLTPVRGVVTLDGKPVDNATVIFMPQQSGSGKQATGQTSPDGSFQLTTRNTNDGALPGEYRVIVQYEEGTEVPPAANMKDAKAGARKAQQKAKKPPKYVIPAIYTDPAKTVLKQKVPTEGPVKLELQSK